MRWLLASTIDRRAINVLADGMRSDEYQRGKNEGFILDSVLHESISGRFVEEFTTTTIVTSPTGIQTKYSQIEYCVTQFRISVRPFNIELHSEPKSFRSFAHKLAGLLNFELAISVPKVNLIQWVEALKIELPVLKVTKITFDGISLSPSVSAKVTLQGTEDVRPFIHEITQGRTHLIQAVTFEAAQLSATLRLNCKASSLRRLVPREIDLFRSTLRKAMNL